VNDGVRIGGRAELPDGSLVVWSVAAGLRGRRWREAVSRGGGVRRSILLEASPAGGATRLEMTTTSGLLTLHPDRDGRELHGNVVTPRGVRHLRFDWSFEHELVVIDSLAAAAIVLHRFADLVAIGESRPIPVVWVDDTLEPRPGAWQVTRTAADGWQLDEVGGPRAAGAIRIDEDGLPVLVGGDRWPLALD
jgi:hypothetical protein